jgi:hypothetical protein
VSPLRYELRFYIPEDDILHSHRREYLKSYVVLNDCTRNRIEYRDIVVNWFVVGRTALALRKLKVIMASAFLRI